MSMAALSVDIPGWGCTSGIITGMMTATAKFIIMV